MLKENKEQIDKNTSKDKFKKQKKKLLELETKVDNIDSKLESILEYIKKKE